MSDPAQEKKEKQQKIILSIVFIAGGLFALWSFLLQPNITKRSKLKKDIVVAQELEDENTKLLKNESKYHENKLVAMKILNKLIHKKMPPVLGAETWLAECFRNVALQANLDEKSITIKIKKTTTCPGSHHIAKKLKKGEKLKTKQALLVRVPVVVSMKCTYHELGKYLEALEEKMPYSEISNLILTKDGSKIIKKKKLQPRDMRMLNVNIDVRIPRFNEQVITEMPTEKVIMALEKKMLKRNPKKLPDNSLDNSKTKTVNKEDGNA